jgi:hypothetical protein
MIDPGFQTCMKHNWRDAARACQESCQSCVKTMMLVIVTRFKILSLKGLWYFSASAPGLVWSHWCMFGIGKCGRPPRRLVGARKLKTVEKQKWINQRRPSDQAPKKIKIFDCTPSPTPNIAVLQNSANAKTIRHRCLLVLSFNFLSFYFIFLRRRGNLTSNTSVESG